jgi:hypothetical protein
MLARPESKLAILVQLRDYHFLGPPTAFVPHSVQPRNYLAVSFSKS